MAAPIPYRRNRDSIELCKTDLQKVISYLNDAAKLYDALPMQSLKSRAHMITQLTSKLKNKTKQ